MDIFPDSGASYLNVFYIQYKLSVEGLIYIVTFFSYFFNSFLIVFTTLFYSLLISFTPMIYYYNLNLAM